MTWIVLLIAGVIGVAAGILIVAFRTRVARWQRDAQQVVWGKIDKQGVKNQTPGRVTVTGVGFVLLGAGFIVAGLITGLT